ncbi:antibiotic biosynthesis monooxygenase [Nonomuraea turkmeniaca]|uniref:Antibiotic biosynthesis monooxygenase n=1 Tax=Nonomuraea turkmeniaca TaxID=103838 RepID=A0A5S4EVF5_9ACTN|nr:antibiotic biosynthesis monooxygenase [Nonomuraea turkmeniaca]TMR06714.1 antibiotic biosynthesis monooxygenase [Nonomuraea turkmeniaca]
MSPSKVRVLLWYRASEGEEQQLIDAFHAISGTLRGTPGLLGSELWRPAHDTADFVVVSEWESRQAFETWERGSAHKADTAPLRPYRDPRRERPFMLLDVVAAY